MDAAGKRTKVRLSPVEGGMRHLRMAACSGLLCLLLAPAALEAAALRVKSHPENPPGNRVTGYYLLPNGSFTKLPANQAQRHHKIRNNSNWGPHPLTDRPVLPPGTYYLFPECQNTLRLLHVRISENEGEIELRCQ
jgi:hypothetical protein